ncbi:MAG: 50S ribosomal protein L10 [Candidatus Doudnabacteria bacterium RIFCSPHIGHO2_02_FULL_48_21]|uniref:Large ribosomal subunit protein uL10 n=1 Tax=Candidatus Doudnabacteria bacterium RIFCSPLOWO2_02_FULL_48_13 TaxID=1817845 RepID=A0A1F5QBB3_9BACT|nr:MAG: 50S ribosomal protein L10 [Candidatus Doudnabacteria bacterium RIFCSPHIGHO2_01_48_18]OGE77319.1 MAG: 50S ribosomal protein L10 [Candidatus Doudnabacteria bacterium RIFCSPHIGHO2_01_FULL_48_180]OGE91001.1 MAG: 50S ribosomal protein L10 [Candidatus Doudnabacteria bacterium RIFCSPHIGHO2_12_FULL_47_25]OGE92857.1 MAG: 50S ribosomal protein L10 [Candidatus Doudnabacteria bacterium RIFCSPHIGHO2_02_FULL_48_21]OGE96890.1 MAG: 50S ribosomal protein L10 [Candidatus Doudnabacteria bacterium RIFCSPLO
MLNKQEKKDLVIKLAEDIKASKAAVFCDFAGLPTREIQKIRSTLRKENVSYKVVKINLLKKALRLAGIDIKALTLNKPMAVSLSADDETAAARILHTFAKTQENLKIVSGMLDNAIIDASQVKALASLPTKQELLGQLVGVIAGPVRNLVGVLSGNVRQLVYVLNAIGQNK